MENVKIDGSCVYVPLKYEGRTIWITEKGKDIEQSNSQIKTPVNYDSYYARGYHQNKVSYGIEYEIWARNPKEYIGTAKWSNETSSYSNTSHTEEKKGCWGRFFKIIMWLIIIFIILSILGAIF